MFRLRFNILSFVILVGMAGLASAQDGGRIDEDTLKALHWRCIGPAIMGGRATAVAGIPGDPLTFYGGTATGGLHKTTNGGATFEPIFDEVGIHSIGAIAIAPSDPNVIYVGTGEANPRNSAAIGRGVYKSVDAGKTWVLLGLEKTEKIARIRIHPTDPDGVVVAALGHEWDANEERGIYRSTDGGATWTKTLYVNDTTGAADLAMDPENPRIFYAAMYDFLRLPWHLRSGGPGSGLYRSTDGGESWTNLFEKAPANGLPKGVIGRIGVAPAPSDARIVYALIESEEEGELWRSDDRGENWNMVNADSNVNSRPFYYTDLRVDPADPKRVYSLSSRLMMSEDGGRNFSMIGGDIHPDHHAMWIDPENPNRILEGNDGGFYISRDRGRSWETMNVIPLGQFYQIGADMRDPYYVCGGLQDNGIWCGPSTTRNTPGILNDDWQIIHFGDGYYTQIDPSDWRKIYTNAHYGNIVRVDALTGEKQSIQPYPVSLRGAAASDHPYRFNWNSPIHMSPNDSSIVYFGSNVLFKTSDGGHSWVEISPDLTTNDPEKIVASGGPITPDNTSAEYHCTILTIAESPLQDRVVWVGTDDGNVQVTQDGGQTWKNVVENIANLPDHSWASRVEASRTAAGTAYITFDRHRFGDMKPYIYKTTDFGETWTDLRGDLPELGYLHVVREDPNKSGLLYTGSEFGIFASFDDGRRWVPLHGDSLPPVPVRDIVIHPRDNDLIVGTHGRSIWILDDVTPLQQLADASKDKVFLFASMPATRHTPRFTKPFLADQTFHGEGAPNGAVVSYYLGAEPGDDETVDIKVEDLSGNDIRTLKGTKRIGINRVTWALDYDPLGEERARQGGFGPSIPMLRVLPGTYTIRLSALGEEKVGKIEVRMDPEVEVSEADLEAQHEAAKRLTRMQQEASEALTTITGLQGQFKSLTGDLEAHGDETLIAEAEAITDKLETLRLKLVSDPGGYRSPTQLQGKVNSLLSAVGSVSHRPTAAQSEWIDTFDSELRAVRAELDTLVNQDVVAFNRKMNESGVPRVFVKPKK